VRQGDPLAPLLFNLTLQPLLNSLLDANIPCQAHADDMALTLSTQLKVDLALSILSDYEKTSGALLNKHKSIALSNTDPPSLITPFITCTKGERYLGINLLPSGEIKLLPNTLSDVLSSLSQWRKLPLSMFGRMTALNAYIRPKILFQAAVITNNSDDAYVNMEYWFLSPGTSPFDPTRSYRRLINQERASHPLTCGRLNDYFLARDMKRASTLIAIASAKSIQHQRWHPHLCWLPNVASQTHLSLENYHLRNLITSFRSLLPRTGLPIQRTDKNGKPRLNGTFLSITKVHPSHPLFHPSSQSFRKIIKSSLLSDPLPLTPAQQIWSSSFKTDWLKLLKIMKRTHLRPSIDSFAWKLIHHLLPIHSHLDKKCDLCGVESLSTTHLFNSCTAIPSSFHKLSSLLTPPHKPRSISLILLHLWSIWKAYCSYSHTSGFNRTIDKTKSFIMKIQTEEQNRLSHLFSF
jgi:hypothetical protein